MGGEGGEYINDCAVEPMHYEADADFQGRKFSFSC